MKLTALLFNITVNLYCQEFGNVIEIDDIYGDTVEYSFYLDGNGSFIGIEGFLVIFENDKGTVMKTCNVKPKPYENLHLAAILNRGIYRIIFYDRKKKFLAKSEFFTIR